jgi:hypothetical protein
MTMDDEQLTPPSLVVQPARTQRQTNRFRPNPVRERVHRGSREQK